MVVRASPTPSIKTWKSAPFPWPPGTTFRLPLFLCDDPSSRTWHPSNYSCFREHHNKAAGRSSTVCAAACQATEQRSLCHSNDAQWHRIHLKNKYPSLTQLLLKSVLPLHFSVIPVLASFLAFNCILFILLRSSWLGVHLIHTWHQHSHSGASNEPLHGHSSILGP